MSKRATKAMPFTVFEAEGGRMGVRIGTQKSFASVDEVTVTAGMVIVTMTTKGIRIEGEGVVRRHGAVIAITP